MDQPLHTVKFAEEDLRAEVARGTTLRDAARDAGVVLSLPCAGLGTCGGCVVSVEGLLDEPGDEERALLSPSRLSGGERLACRARAAGDVVVRRVGASLSTARIVESAIHEPFEVEAPALRGITGGARALGAAVDVGTTTLVARLVDLETGATIRSVSALNPQRTFGADVMSRISQAAIHGVDEIRAPLVRLLGELLGRLSADETLETVREIALCGNPTMTHILLGIDPQPLGLAPYAPAYEGAVDTNAAELGLPGPARTPVHVLPAVSAFVGSDIVAGLLATGLDRSCGTSVLIDLGTNGEIVARTPDGMVAASTAAGPALEGGEISSGTIAADGAIEHVAVAADGLDLAVIGGGEPNGLCGSGLIDLVAALLDAGVLDDTGLLHRDAPGPVAARVRESDGVLRFEVVSGVSLTQHDVRQVQLAVGAVAAGLGALLDEVGVRPADVERVVIAGGFGSHVEAAALARIGIIPREWVDRTTFVGNTALAGTVAALLSTTARRRAAALARHVRTVDLATRPDFQTRFISGLNFPSA